jgi:hypothetical protein
MNPKPPSTYNFEESERLLSQLEQVTQAILQLSTGENLPQLNQLILEREQIIKACQGIPVEAYTAAQKKCLKSRIDACQALDLTAHQNMDDFKTEIGKQLRQVKQGQNLLGKYQILKNSNQETHNEDA